MKKIRKQLLTAIGIAATVAASAQSPELDAWLMNTTGHQASYDYYPGPPPTTSNVQMTDSSDVQTACYNTTDVYVRATGLASYTMGPWLMNPNVPSGQGYVFKIPRTPAEETGAKTGTPFGGAAAVAVNGIVMYGYGDGKSYSSSQGANVTNGDGNWVGDAWVSEGSTMDASGNGHADGGGNYHYHANPSTLYTDPSTSHSPIIGYAFDGYPIYGPFGYSTAMDSTSGVVRMSSSYSLRSITDRTILPNGSTSTPAGPTISSSFPLGTYIQDYEYVVSSGTLDEYQGRDCVTPEYPGGTYAYFISTDSNGDPQFPYIFAESFYGVLSTSDLNSAGSFSVPGGLTCGGTITSSHDTLYPSDTLLTPAMVAQFNTSDILSTWTLGYCPIAESGGDTTFAPCYTVTYNDHYVASIDLCPANLDSVGGIGLHLGDPWLLDSNLFIQMEIDGSDIIYNNNGYQINYQNLTSGVQNDGGGPGVHYCIEADLFLGTSDPWYQSFQILIGPIDEPGMAIPYGTAEAIGLLIDGVILEHTPPSSESVPAQGGGIIPIDYCGWHPEPFGFGHFHAVPTGINVPLQVGGIDTTKYGCVDVDQKNYSGLAGFTFEGIPIYGPYEDGQTTAPTGLDPCNGHTAVTPDYPSAVYHYHASAVDIINNPPCHNNYVPLEQWEYGEWTGGSIPNQPGSITGLDSVCNGQSGVSYSISAVTGATSYNWAVPSGASIVSGSGTTSITVDFGSSTGSICVNASNTFGASSDECLAIDVVTCGSAPNQPGAVTGLDSVCTSQTGVSYSISAVAGATSYNWTVPSGASIASGSGTTSITVDFGSSSGNVCVNASNSFGASANQCSTVNAVTCGSAPSQPGAIVGLDSLCNGQTSLTYSISAVTSATSYSWTVPSGATIVSGAGTVSITVDFGTSSGNVCVNASNSFGSSADECLAVQVTACGSAPGAPGMISGLDTICPSQPAVAYSIAAVTGATSYTWTVPSGATITSGSGSTSITVDFGVSAGSICVSASNGFGTSADTCITINAASCGSPPDQPGAISGLDSVCDGQASLVYSISAVTGATSYNWMVPSGATIVSGSGTTSITVDFGSTSGNVCVNAANSHGSSADACVAVNVAVCGSAPNAPGLVSGLDTVCPNQPSVAYSISAVTGATSYTWTVPSGATIVSGTGTTSISVDFGSASGSVCVDATNSFGTSSSICFSVNVAVCGSAPNTPGLITGLDTVCPTQPAVSYSIAAVTGADTYTWTAPAGAAIISGQGTTDIEVDMGFSSGNVCVNASNGFGTSSDMCFAIEVDSCGQAPLAPGSVTGLDSICPNQPGVSYSIAPVTGATTYTWMLPPGASITSGAGTTSITVDFGPGPGNICVRAENSNGFSAFTCKSVTLAFCGATPYVPGPIAGLDSVCNGQTSISYSISAVAGANTYNWTVPSGATIVSGAGTTDIVVDFGSTSGNVCVSATNGFGTSADSCIAVNVAACGSAPDQPGAIAGLDSLCNNQTNMTYSISAVAGATSYNWTVPSGAAIVSGSGTTVIIVDFGSGSGNVCVNASNSFGSSSSTCLAITVATCGSAPADAGLITGLDTICPNQTSVSYSIAAVTGATSYNWTVPSGASIVSGSGTTDIVVDFGSSAGNICVNASNSFGSSADTCITINTASCGSAPNTPGPVAGLDSLCPNQPGVSYSISAVTGATSYNWTIPSDATITLGQGTTSIIVNFGFNSGNVCVNASNSFGASVDQCVAVSIVSCGGAAPQTPGLISGLDFVCDGEAGVTYSIAAVTDASSYNWTVPSGATITSGAGTVSITVDFGSTSGNVCVNASNSFGSSADTCKAIGIVTCGNPPSTPGAISGLDTACTNETGIVYTISAVTGADSYNWTVPSGAAIVSGSGTTSITVDFGTTTGDVCVNASNAFGASSDVCLTIEVIVCGNAPNTPGSITGLDTICPNQPGVTYSIAAVTGANTYNWTVPAGATVTSGAGTTSITVDFGSAAGDVCVDAENSFGTSSQECFTTNLCIMTGVYLIENKDQLTIYPNPVSDGMITLDGAYSSYIIYDMIGEKVLQSNRSSMGGKTQIDLSHLVSGVYFISAEHGNLVLFEKIVVQ